MHQAETVVLLFAAVAALAIIARKLALPYPIVLVMSGLALSFIPRLPEVKLNPEIVFYFFLPALLYPAALFTSWRDFRRKAHPRKRAGKSHIVLAILWPVHLVPLRRPSAPS